MNISTTISKHEFKRILLKFTINSYVLRKRTLGLALVYFFIALQYGSFTDNKILDYLLLYPLIGILLYGLYIALKYWSICQKSLRLNYNENQSMSIYISAVNDGIQIKTSENESIVLWRNVLFAKKYENYIIIQLLDYSTFIIPFSLFETEEKKSEYVKSIEEGIIKIRGSLRVPYFIRPPYLIGVFCFIPLVGIFPSIILIISGIFHYKNKWLIVNGVLGIVFTIVFYSVAFPSIWNKKEQDKQWQSLSQSFLNNIVRDLEFYKVQHGHYPDNLTQLTESNKTLIISDPLQAGENQDLFNYELEGNNYKLYSSGLDKKVNTNDDIYPDIQDTLNIGLIRKK
jgi:hypothetical protein